MAIKIKKKNTPENNIVTLIGKNVEFEGNLKFHGTVRIDGKFKGTISGDGTIVIEEHGILESNIHVSEIVICGEIHGDISAENRIDLRESGRVFGNIQAPIVGIEPGAILQGSCKTHQVKYVDDEKATMTSSVKPKEAQKVTLLPKAS